MPRDSSPNLQLYSAPAEQADPARPGSMETCSTSNVIEQLECQEMWRAASQRKRSELQPLTREWFEWLEQRRYARHGSWLPRRMEFHKHAGDKILCLGHGLGTDWVRYAANGAQVIVLHPSADQLALVRRNFEVRQLAAQWIHAPFTALPQRDNSMDIVCLSGLHGQLESLPGIIAEIYRVLRPGGKVFSILPAWYNVIRWQELVHPWINWFRRTKPSGNDPKRFSSVEVREIFRDFSEHRLYQRHLRRSDLPHLWRWLPLPLLERVMGKYILLKAFKPLSSALGIAAAA
jgi:SAM-dependent methyltransferase